MDHLYYAPAQRFRSCAVFTSSLNVSSNGNGVGDNSIFLGRIWYSPNGSFSHLVISGVVRPNPIWKPSGLR